MRLTQHALTDVGTFLMVVLGALAIERLLATVGHPEWGRDFGYWGTVLIIASFVHSARKRKLIRGGRPFRFLRVHEVLTCAGAMMILIHGGTIVGALLPWSALAAMLVTVASGFTGRYLLRISSIQVSERKQALLGEGIAPDEVEERLYWASLDTDSMKKWRTVHLPITTFFFVLTLLHVLSVLVFWRW